MDEETAEKKERVQKITEKREQQKKSREAKSDGG